MMRQLNNIHFDTKEGASGCLAEIVSSQFAPSVSQKDEIMTKQQRDLLIELVRVERRRLNNAKRLTSVSLSSRPFTYNRENDELNKEIKLVNETLEYIRWFSIYDEDLEGGK